MLNKQFQSAIEIVKSLPKKGPLQVSTDKKLYLYSLYKIGTVGKNNTKKPSYFDVIGRLKWNSWKKLENLDANVAKEFYVKEIKNIIKNTYLSGDFEKYLKYDLSFIREIPQIHYEILFKESLKEEMDEDLKEKLIYFYNKYFPENNN